MKDQGKAKTYCYKIAELCFSLTFEEDAVEVGEIFYHSSKIPNTIPATVFLYHYYRKHVGVLQCLVRTNNKNHHFFITTFNENMNPIFVFSNDDMNNSGSVSLNVKVSGIST